MMDKMLFHKEEKYLAYTFDERELRILTSVLTETIERSIIDKHPTPDNIHVKDLMEINDRYLCLLSKYYERLEG